MLARAMMLLMLLVLAGCDTTPVIDCDLSLIAQMPLEVEDHLLVVPAGINGKWVKLWLIAELSERRSATPRRNGWGCRMTHGISITTKVSAAAGRRPM